MLLYLLLGASLGLTSALNKENTVQKNGGDELYSPNVDFQDAFDWKLLKEFAASHKNVLLSPISLKLILALLYQTSTGFAEREFQNVLQFFDKHSVNEEYSRILNSLQASERSEYLLNMGTSMFLDVRIPVNPHFEINASKYYRTEMRPTNFQDSRNASTTINSWVDKITNGKVSEIVKPGDLQQTVLLIANALYFKGTWQHQFPKNQTYFGNFIVNADDIKNIETVTIPYMSTTDTFYLKESPELDSRILRLPYRGSGYSMYIILPNSLGGLPNLIKKINLYTVSTLLYSLEKRLVEVNIPKFKFNFKTKMVEALRKFGFRQIFENSGSFIGITKNGSHPKLVISDIVQKTGIELDEEGSVVYSATDVNIGNKFGEPREIFHVTHPFLFFIQGPNGSILFIGKIENPLENESVALPTNLVTPLQQPISNAASQLATSKQFLSTSENVAPTVRPNLLNSVNQETRIPNLEPFGTSQDAGREELLYRFNLFDMELLNVFSESNINVFISPASIKTTLAMVLEGAKGTCAEEISEALRIPNINQKGVREILAGLLNALKERSPTTYLENSNGIFVSDKYKVVDKYHNIISNFYDGSVNTISFKNVAKAVTAINNWVSQATHDTIKEIIGPQSISPETSAVILNALYFKGQWKVSFDSQNTKTTCFRTVNGCVPTSMMRVSSNFNYSYISRLRAHAIEVPYENKFSMLILLPSEEASIRSVIRDLPHFKLVDILNTMNSSDITLEIPKFEFDYSADLVEYLKLLKIREIFETRANLSGIVENNNVLINSLVHKTRIEVNEEGTVAAAATGAIVIPLMGSTSIIVDRPFIFYIYHQETANIIFEGILMNPQEQGYSSGRLTARQYSKTKF